MQNASLIRGSTWGIQYNTFYNEAKPIGHWSQELYNIQEYGASCVQFIMPQISDRMKCRSVTMDCAFVPAHGVQNGNLYAILSTAEPSGTDWRFGPSSNIVSNEVTFNKSTTSLTFEIIDDIWLSGKEIYVYFFQKNNGYGSAHSLDAMVLQYCNNATISYSLSYVLSIADAQGSQIKVDRQSSNYVATGTIANGEAIYTGDSLKILVVPLPNYRITSLTVNGEAFESGNIYIVSGNVIVVSGAEMLATNVGATDSDIGSVSTVTLTRYNPTYWHSLQYCFGELTGYITSNGGVSDTEARFQNESVAFSIPSSFYYEIQNSKSGACRIVCMTYESEGASTILGNATSCTITVTANRDICKPIVNGNVVDTNQTTIALTHDSGKLVRFMSEATCTIQAQAINGASIKEKYINGIAINGPNKIFTGDSLTSGSFQFSAIDSRGYTGTSMVLNDMIPYVKLTCNPVFYRYSPSSGEVALTFNGNVFAGDWRDGVRNNLSIRYRYRKSNSNIFSDWITIYSNVYTVIGSKYQTIAPIILEDESGSTTGFDYKTIYIFQIEITDGDGANIMSTVLREVTVQAGTPVFDWGKNDFSLHVPLSIQDVDSASAAITIGNTSITEEQLRRLLALL